MIISLCPFADGYEFIECDGTCEEPLGYNHLVMFHA